MRFAILAAAALLLAVTAPIVGAQLPEAALITMEGEGIDMAAIDAVVSFAGQNGGHIMHVMTEFGPGNTLTGATLIGAVTPQAEAIVRRLPHVRDVGRDRIQPERMTGMKPEAAFAAHTWNRLLATDTAEEQAVNCEPLMNDARPALVNGRLPGEAAANGPLPGPTPPTPGKYQTSEYMLRKVSIGIIMPESQGGSENWMLGTPPPGYTYRHQAVQAKIAAGAGWWGTQGGSAANLTFYYWPSMASTTYEPITQSIATEGSWISECLGNLGFNGTDYLDQVYNFDNYLRGIHGSDWAFTVFVADSYNDVDGCFTDGFCAYAYRHGPFMVMTYDNDGWGISSMNQVFAHEMGHIFGAPDEYAGVSTCNPSVCGNLYGYLGAVNGNCASCTTNQVQCVMQSDDLTVAPCSYTQIHVGWKDSDADGIYDPIDTMPSGNLNLQYYVAPYWGSSQINGSGVVQDTPWPSPTRTPVSINKVYADYDPNYPSGWVTATPTDGTFDSAYESYSFTTTGMPDGSYTVGLRARTALIATFGVPQPITIDTTPPQAPLWAFIVEAPFSADPTLLNVQCGLGMTPDPESGVSHVAVALGTSPTDSGSGYIAETQIPYPLPVGSLSGLSLSHGSGYYVYTKTVNRAGLSSSPSVVGGPVTIDLTPPGPPTVVTDAGAGTGAWDRLTFSWNPGTEDVSYINNYLLTIRDQNGAAIVTDVPTGNVLAHTESGLSLSAGNTYTGEVKSRNIAGVASASPGASNGIMAVTFYPTIGNAKLNASMGDAVGINSVYIASSGADNPGAIYVEHGGMASGIRSDNNQSLARNTEVQVAGALSLNTSGELELSNSLVEPSGGVPVTVRPRALAGRSVGGATFGLQPGVINGVGLNTVGLLVTVMGNVTYRNPASPCDYTVDDGSGALDALGNSGVNVRCYSGTPPGVGTYAWATGVCAYENGYPVILVR